MINIENLYTIDGCVYPESEFNGCAEDVKKSNLDGFFLTVPGESFRGAVKSIAKNYMISDVDSEKISIPRTYEDLFKAKREGKKSAILYFQDPHPVENKMEFLRAFYELGIRVVQMAYNKGGYIGAGCTENVGYGLTDFGKNVVREMNELGVLIDLSHCGKKTVEDVLRESKKPVTFGHANPFSIANNPRNKTDEQLKMLANNGGVIGITAWGPICWNGKENKRPTVEDLIDHMDYVINLIGDDHVGIASDNNLDHSKDIIGINSQGALYDEVVGPYNKHVGVDPNERHTKGFAGAVDIDNLIICMRNRGYADERIKKIMGGNFLRVLKDVWR